MILELHERLGHPMRIHATRVLIRDDNGTPLALAIEIAPGHVRHIRAGDKDFEHRLAENGVADTVIVTELEDATLAPKGVPGTPYKRSPKKLFGV